jgi:hypothetical protein
MLILKQRIFEKKLEIAKLYIWSLRRDSRYEMNRKNKLSTRKREFNCETREGSEKDGVSPTIIYM